MEIFKKNVINRRAIKTYNQAFIKIDDIHISYGFNHGLVHIRIDDNENNFINNYTRECYYQRDHINHTDKKVFIRYDALYGNPLIINIGEDTNFEHIVMTDLNSLHPIPTNSRAHMYICKQNINDNNQPDIYNFNNADILYIIPDNFTFIFIEVVGLLVVVYF